MTKVRSPFLLTSIRFKMWNFYEVLEIHTALIIHEIVLEVINILVCRFLTVFQRPSGMILTFFMVWKMDEDSFFFSY